MSNGHRWSKFWWADWQNDAALRVCSLGAQGYWMRLLCIAHDADRVGHVLLNGRQPTERQLAVLTGASKKEQVQYEAELEENGVFSRTDDGTIYSRRMVKDAVESQSGRENIAKRWGNQSHPPPKPNGQHPPNRVPISKPSRNPTSEPTSPPTSLDTESDSEAEKKKVSIYNNLTYNSIPAREDKTAAEIQANRAEAASELRAAGPFGDVAVAVGKALKWVAYSPGWSPKRTAQEQLNAVAPQLNVRPAYLSREQLKVAHAAAQQARGRARA